MVDAIGGIVNRLVLPHSHDLPSRGSESEVRIGVTFSVSLKLCAPPLGIALRTSPMLGAGMPEAPVYKHDNSGPHEDNIGLAPYTYDRPAMQKVSESSGPVFRTRWLSMERRFCSDGGIKGSSATTGDSPSPKSQYPRKAPAPPLWAQESGVAGQVEEGFGPQAGHESDG